ncbi:MAG TPA: ABC transporter permease [Polyangiaceae bacterium]|nr:ABC transporter permease [Polyangiaceae bacterium]
MKSSDQPSTTPSAFSSGAGRRPPRWLAVRTPLARRESFAVGLLAFALPLLVWSLISYVPFIWHPLVLVEDPGDSKVSGQYDFIAAGQRVDLDVFEQRNKELARAGKPLARGSRANPIFLPAPHEVGAAFYTAFTTPPQRTGDYWLHESLLQSCKIIFWGFLCSALLGVPLGILCGSFALFSRLFEPFVDFIRYMPAPVFGALAVAVLGLGDEPKITIIFIGTFFQMVLVVANTTRSVDPSLLHAAQTLGASNRQLLAHVVIPAALPALYRDMRILIGWAWTYLVVAELIGEKSGISAFLYQQQRYMHFENVYAGIVMIGVIGLVTDQVLAFLGRFLFPWESGNTAFSRWSRALSRAFSARTRLSPLTVGSPPAGT